MLDLIILTVLVLGLVRGLFTGVIRQVTSVIGLIAAFLLAMYLRGPVGGMIVEELAVPQQAGAIIAFVLIFGVVQLVVVLVTRLLEKILKVLRLSALNRAAGGVLGALKGAFVLSIFFFIFSVVNLPDESAREESQFYDPVASVVPTAWGYISDHLPAIKGAADGLSKKAAAALPVE